MWQISDFAPAPAAVWSARDLVVFTVGMECSIPCSLRTMTSVMQMFRLPVTGRQNLDPPKADGNGPHAPSDFEIL